MSSFNELLFKWAVQELNLISEGRLKKVPDISTLSHLTLGKNKKIWPYVVHHVRSRNNVSEIKRILLLKRKLDEERDNQLAFFSVSEVKPDELHQIVRTADEKRTSEICSLNVIEERIVYIQKGISCINESILKLNAKCTILEFFSYLFREKKSALKDTFNRLLPYLNMLKAYREKNVCRKYVTVPKNNVFFNYLLTDKTEMKLKVLTEDVVSLLIRVLNSCGKYSAESKETFVNRIGEIVDYIILPTLLSHLKSVANASLDKFAKTTLGRKSVRDFLCQKKESDPYKNLINHLKHRHIQNCFDAKRCMKTAQELFKEKENICFKLKNSYFMSDNQEFLLMYDLNEKVAENEAYIEGNRYLSECLSNEQLEAEILIKVNNKQKLKSEDLQCVMKRFYENNAITCRLINSSSNMFHHIYETSNNLNIFTSVKIFPNVTISLKEYSTEIKAYLKRDKKLLWLYCDRAALFKSLCCEPYSITDPLSNEAAVLLNMLPFENIGMLCEKWAVFKKNVYAHTYVGEFSFNESNQIMIGKKYALLMGKLHQMKQALAKGIFHIHEGHICSNQCKILLEEWSNQNAQFVPYVQYEDKTLKMWLDILHVLPDIQFPYIS